MGEHLDYNYKIAAIDFDDTLAVNEFPEVGAGNIPLVNKIKEFQAAGNKWILWTCRTADALRKAREWCEEQGIVPDAINEDVPDVQNSVFGRNKSVKVHADILVDDKCPSSIDAFLNMNFSSSEEQPSEVRMDLIGTILR